MERSIGRLPRPLAYSLILLYSIVTWSLIGITAAGVLRHFEL